MLSLLRRVWGALERFSFSAVGLMFCFVLIDLQLCLLPHFPLQFACLRGEELAIFGNLFL